MKKFLLVAVMAFGFGFNATAQDVTFGVKAGLNFSNLKFDTNISSGSNDTKTGFYIGGLADFGVSEVFHIQPEVLYSSEGTKVEYDGSKEDGNISFINIPVLAKFYVAEGFNIQAGPQLGILVDADGGTDGLKTTNFSLSFGAGYELPGGFFFDARYSLGLTDISEIDEIYIGNMVISGIDVKTRNFQVGFGYRF
ncbi:porin family protein [Sinomicrobium weinanense]|uniref:PorT family protein n=1 Tax=Sinomicrobium weinanense TaxID=2842200 RepID=A0A926JRS9_9FLAO|nr:porin family protein [Sinomicrobium weinanense]MBC9796174.1 PorT family protein [Sinomicrobium weinanense]MBU3123453.1 PorT family protein [Sinomicrobium weinanense]